MISDPPVKEDVKQERAVPATARETPETGKPAAPPDTTAPDEPQPRRRWLRWLLILGAVAIAVYLFAHRPGQNKGGNPQGPGQGEARGGAGGRGGQDRPVPVLAAAAKTKDVGVYLTGLGTVAPLNTVGVKSRVDGQLLRVAFHEGQIVRA
ncbi:MAG TPA: hypothetical protein VFC23_08445, partial [Thermoanaerobaculia bacterium]|nr:hypothetical protein [Thermoanaerobaculia bacterium]